MYNRLDIASSFFEQLLTQIERTAGAMSSYDIYTVKFRLIEAAKNLRQIYASDPTQLHTHLLSCLEYEQKLLAHPMEQQVNVMTTSNNNTTEISQTLLKLREKIQECEKINHTLKREYENYNTVSDDFNKRIFYFDECERQKPEQRAQIAVARRQQNEHLMVQINRINSFRLSLYEEYKNLIDEAEKILDMVKTNFLYEWMKQQKCDAIKYLGAQTDCDPLDSIQSWYERLAEIFWKTYEGIKAMKSYQMHFNKDDQGTLECLGHLEQRSLRLLQNLLVTSFIVEKQPPQIIVQERSGGKK